MKKNFLLLSAWSILSLCLFAQQGLESQLLSQGPEAFLQQLQTHNIPLSDIQLSFVRADFDGTKKFAYIVALYNTSADTALRIFKQSPDGTFVVFTDLDPTIHVGGVGAELKLIDVDNDGIPEIYISSHGAGAHYTFDILKLNGSALTSLVPEDVDTFDANLIDVDHNGQLAIVDGPISSDEGVAGDYRIYKLSNGSFALASQSDDPPTGLVAAYSAISLVHPHKFALERVRQPGDKHDHGEIVVEISQIRDIVPAGVGTGGSILPGQSKGISAEKVDLATITLAGKLRPLRTRIRYSKENREDMKKPALRAYKHSSARKIFWSFYLLYIQRGL